MEEFFHHNTNLAKNKYFGVGLKNFRYVCDEKFDTFTQKKFLCSTHPHNLYLEILSETGLIGFVIFLVL